MIQQHIRTKHNGMEDGVNTMQDQEKDAHIEELLEECTTLLKPEGC